MAHKLHHIAIQKQLEITQLEERNKNLTSAPYFPQIHKILKKKIKPKKLKAAAKDGKTSYPIISDLDLNLEPKIVNKCQVMRDFVDLYMFIDGYRLVYVENNLKTDPFAISATSMFNVKEEPRVFIHVEW